MPDYPQLLGAVPSPFSAVQLTTGRTSGRLQMWRGGNDDGALAGEHPRCVIGAEVRPNAAWSERYARMPPPSEGGGTLAVSVSHAAAQEASGAGTSRTLVF